MNTYLWFAQAILAFVFLGSGVAKSAMSREKLAATGQTGAASQPEGLIRFVACCEILGAAGLILPYVLGIGRFLTPLAALGLAIIMIGAARIHTKQKESRAVAVNAAMLALCVFVAFGRW
jgi:hypothetical protein